MSKNLKPRLITIFTLIVSFCSILSVIIFTSPHSSALSEDTLDFFDQNNIYYYDPEGTAACGGSGSVPTLAGNTVEEKIWNYFATANIPGVSDNPSAIAGIMGNLYQESGYDPFVTHDGFLGMFMLQNHEALKSQVEKSYKDYYWTESDHGDTLRYPQDVLDGAIRIELDYLTQKHTQFTKTFLKGISSATHKTGEDGAGSFAELFLATVEIAIYGEYTLTDPGVQKYMDDYYGGTRYKYQQGQERVNKAREIYNKYASGSSSSSSLSSSVGNCVHSLSENFTQYNQYDKRWAGLRFGSGGIHGSVGSTIGSAGCGPTSFAMMASDLLGKEILPSETTDIAGKAGIYTEGSGSSWDITKVLADAYGLEYESISVNNTNDAIDKINEHLKNGWMIHTSGSGKAPFTSGGHYIAIRGITSSGKWLIYDSNGAKGIKNSKTEWNPEDIVNAGMALANIKAVRAKSPTCGRFQQCNTGGATSGGLSDQDAEKLVAYYKSNKTDSDGTPWQEGTKWNCTSMVAWFLHNFTSIETAGGNGRDVAYNLKNTHHIQTGKTPKPYSVFSVTQGVTYCGATLCGHTGIVIAVNGDDITTIEAYWGKINVAEVVHHDISYFVNAEHPDAPFGYLDTVMDINKLNNLLSTSK